MVIYQSKTSKLFLFLTVQAMFGCGLGERGRNVTSEEVI